MCQKIEKGKRVQVGTHESSQLGNIAAPCYKQLHFRVQTKQGGKCALLNKLQKQNKDNFNCSTWQVKHLVPASPSVQADPDRQGLENHFRRSVLKVCW